MLKIETFKLSVLLLLAMCIGVCSCTSSIDLAANIKNTQGNFPQKHYFKTPTYVFLDDKNPEATISYIDKVMFLKNRIVVIDLTNGSKRNRLLLFDKNGKFIASSDKYVGHGKNEFSFFTDCTIDTEKQLIYMCCDTPCQYLVFDSNLKLVKCIKTQEYMQEITMDKKYLYGVYHNPDKVTSYELRRYDKRDLAGGHEVLVSFDHTIARTGAMGHSLCGNDDHIAFSMLFDNKIYEIKDGAVQSETSINFEDDWFSYEESKNLRGRNFFKLNRNKIWAIKNICGSDSVFLFNTNLPRVYKVNKKTQMGESYKLLGDASRIIPACGQKDIVVQSVPVNSVKIYLKRCKEKNRPVAPNIKKLNVKDNSVNPVLKILTFK